MLVVRVRRLLPAQVHLQVAVGARAAAERETLAQLVASLHRASERRGKSRRVIVIGKYYTNRANLAEKFSITLQRLYAF